MATTATNGKNNWEDKELGCLWRREKQSTKEKYLTGVINLKALGFDKDVQVVCFSNKHKTKDTHPDIRIYISEKKPAAKTATASAPAKAAAPSPAPVPDASELI
jgi:hypothetical protein